MTRRLVLKKETLTDLTTAELGSVAGGGQVLTPNCPTEYCYSVRLQCLLSEAIDPCLGPTYTC